MTEKNRILIPIDSSFFSIIFYNKSGWAQISDARVFSSGPDNVIKALVH
jgi:hypothetical protein